MTTATLANELNHRNGADYSLADAYDIKFLDAEPVEDVEAETRWERYGRWEMNETLFGDWRG